MLAANECSFNGKTLLRGCYQYTFSPDFLDGLFELAYPDSTELGVLSRYTFAIRDADFQNGGSLSSPSLSVEGGVCTMDW